MPDYEVESLEDLRKIISDLPDEMHVEIGSELNLSAKTIGDLREAPAFPAGVKALRIIVPKRKISGIHGQSGDG